MRLLILGDMHLSESKPKRRIDDYKQSQVEKVNSIIEIAEQYKVDITLQPGDLCDSHEFPDKFKTRWIKILKKLPPIFSVPGQHDMRYHTGNIKNTPYGVLSEGVPFTVLDERPYVFKDNIYIYGAAWNKPIPKIITPDCFNILVIHKMIVIEKLWDDQEDYQVAGSFLRRNDFDLIVSGDNHQEFYYHVDNKVLINAGSLMRNRIDQINYKPCVFTFDTNMKTFKKIHVPVASFKDVFDLEEAEKDEKKNIRLSELSDILKKKSRIKGLNYKLRVSNRVNSLKAENSIKPLTERIIGEVMV